MNYLFTTRPTLDAVERMGLDKLQLSDAQFLKSILSDVDFHSLTWALNDASRIVENSKDLLSNSLSTLINITPLRYTGSAVEASDENSIHYGLQGNSQSITHTPGQLPVIDEVMLLGDSTLLLVLEVNQEDRTHHDFYSMVRTSTLKSAMNFTTRQTFLKIMGTVLGVNNMLALPLMGEHIRSS